jgi:hypothetical protein
VSSYIGYHTYPKECDKSGDHFVIFRHEPGCYYWQMVADDLKTERGMINGPFPTAEDAYFAAIGD